ncbi:hypothetical protein BRARA_G01611 [Brassica rapa]|uniref:Uncharacterized protein n=1 Tax=Brassica campestris TaxID=3711 RepID=A0A397YLP9_BRACM|nr:hypothetical protein BRARA_G01611 [Brassica rapa]
MPMVSTLASSPPLLSAGLSVLRETQTVASTGSGRRRRSKPNSSDKKRLRESLLLPLFTFGMFDLNFSLVSKNFVFQFSGL